MDLPVRNTRPAKKANATTLGAGDTIGLTGEITHVHDDGKVTFWLKGYDYPVTLRAEHVSLIAKGTKGRK